MRCIYILGLCCCSGAGTRSWCSLDGYTMFVIYFILSTLCRRFLDFSNSVAAFVVGSEVHSGFSSSLTRLLLGLPILHQNIWTWILLRIILSGKSFKHLQMYLEMLHNSWWSYFRGDHERLQSNISNSRKDISANFQSWLGQMCICRFYHHA